MNNMKLIMERFDRYEKEVLFEQKINEIQETNEFKLFAEGKLDKEEFKSFLIEAYGEELAEGFLTDLGGKLRKLGLSAATIATLLAGAPADVKAAPSSPTTQVVASDDRDQRMQDIAQFVSNAQDIRALELSQSGAGATKEDKKALEAAETKMKDFLVDQGVGDKGQQKLKTAVTTKPSKLKKGSKKSKRRKSFCKRMCGMKKKKTGAKTKRDPDSRINKALRKWNCRCS
jgi:chemotaxis protein histidine kinase CheA